MKTRLLARTAVLLGLAASAQAATFTVTTAEDEFNTPSGSSVSLQEALRDAAASPGPDLITFAPSLSGATLSPRGELFVNDASDVEVSAMALERGVTLSGGNSHRILSVSGNGRLTLRGLTLTAGAPSEGNGGAILNNGELFLVQCAVHGNSAVNGGAIFNNGGTLNLSLTTFAGNSARTTGGAIFNSFGKLTLNHVTATGNSAAGQGGGFFSFGSLATLTLENSIVAGNTGNGGADLYVESGFTVLGANLVQSSAGAPFTGGGTLINSNPLLSPLASRGGPTPTCSLQLGSPAREAAVGGSLGHDQRGYPVVGSPDIGAYETQIGPVTTIFIGQNTPSGAIPLTVGIIGKLTIISGNPVLIPDLNIILNDNGGSYTIILTPSGAGPGLVIITLIDNDSGDIVTFMVQINNEPTVGSLPDTTVMENTSTETIAFTVDDLETPAGDLAVSAQSDNASLAPVGNIVLGGSGKDRTVRVSPVAQQVGNATITIMVSDGERIGTTSFQFTVLPATPLNSWKVAQFGAQAFNPEVTGDLVDADHDGVSNLLEYGFRSSPVASSKAPFSLPVPVTLPGNIPARRFSFPYRPDASEIAYLVQYSKDLVSWSEVYRLDLLANTVTQLSGVTGEVDTLAQTVTVTITNLTYFNGSNYWRLGVEKP